ncbi:uncharacterized protein LOC115679604 [Syzygium oleosum]|uniref:uncharacterized protein LOC115679604 n=1 Tax=Syzygium oleosum TaxID=219896 RepID=UPI0024BA0484|nr:uncharacterized protein LOC115679604 [Syzygium oleosum]XP_056162529.1 uncharacterized protein LOC115679604 [Syzygium oleosum]
MSLRFTAAPLRFDPERASSTAARPNPRPLPLLRKSQAGLDRELSRRRLFILGAGYVGRSFALHMKDRGWAVSGSCRSLEKKMQLEEEGLDAHVLDANVPELSTLDILKDYTHLLVSIPPVRGVGDPMLQHREFLERVLRDGNLQWLCYLSSTGVYGDCGGEWVNEDYPVNPSTELARLRLRAEEEWLDVGHNLGISSLVLRLGGIYGPGRSALDTIISKKPLSDSQKTRISRQYTSRVHVDDICQALRAGIYVPFSSNIYNVVDDDPAPREEVFKYAEDLVGKRFSGWFQDDKYPKRTESTIQKVSRRDEKRVLNTRLKQELGIKLLHPSYKSGLQSIIEQIDVDYG